MRDSGVSRLRKITSASAWSPCTLTVSTSIINRFTVDFEGENVIDVTLEPAISTNPYFEFEATVPASGTFLFTWYDDDGDVYTEEKAITVS